MRLLLVDARQAGFTSSTLLGRHFHLKLGGYTLIVYAGKVEYAWTRCENCGKEI